VARESNETLHYVRDARAAAERLSARAIAEQRDLEDVMREILERGAQ
jgi:hypothetical protein